MKPEEVIARAREYGWQPENILADPAAVAQAFIDARRHKKCEVCAEPIDLEEPEQYFCSQLMGNPAPLVCHACFVLWYDGGMTDPAAMRAEREKQRQASA